MAATQENSDHNQNNTDQVRCVLIPPHKPFKALGDGAISEYIRSIRAAWRNSLCYEDNKHSTWHHHRTHSPALLMYLPSDSPHEMLLVNAQTSWWGHNHTRHPHNILNNTPNCTSDTHRFFCEAAQGIWVGQICSDCRQWPSQGGESIEQPVHQSGKKRDGENFKRKNSWKPSNFILRSQRTCDEVDWHQ